MPDGGFGDSLSLGTAFSSVKLVVAAPRVTAVIEYAFVDRCGTTSFAASRESGEADG